MRNPYEVLEIKEGASKEEIKHAYRDLAKRYHPDQYGDNPLRDLAEEKMREINEAYDYLMKNTPEANNYSNSSYDNSYNYQDIRMDLQNGNLNAAEQKLNNAPVKDAEWNFLMGMLFMRKGWYDNAYNHITTACNMNPNNMEYRSAFNNLNRNNNSYRQPYYGRNRNDCDLCDICATIWIADCICDCLGGCC